MKTLNLHTPNYQPATNMLWAGISVCDFNSKRIENKLGVDNEVKQTQHIQRLKDP